MHLQGINEQGEVNSGCKDPAPLSRLTTASCRGVLAPEDAAADGTAQHDVMMVAFLYGPASVFEEAMERRASDRKGPNEELRYVTRHVTSRCNEGAGAFRRDSRQCVYSLSVCHRLLAADFRPRIQYATKASPDPKRRRLPGSGVASTGETALDVLPGSNPEVSSIESTMPVATSGRTALITPVGPLFPEPAPLLPEPGESALEPPLSPPGLPVPLIPPPVGSVQTPTERPST